LTERISITNKLRYAHSGKEEIGKNSFAILQETEEIFGEQRNRLMSSFFSSIGLIEGLQRINHTKSPLHHHISQTFENFSNS